MISAARETYRKVAAVGWYDFLSKLCMSKTVQLENGSSICGRRFRKGIDVPEDLLAS